MIPNKIQTPVRARRSMGVASLSQSPGFFGIPNYSLQTINRKINNAFTLRIQRIRSDGSIVQTIYFHPLLDMYAMPCYKQHGGDDYGNESERKNGLCVLRQGEHRAEMRDLRSAGQKRSFVWVFDRRVERDDDQGGDVCLFGMLGESGIESKGGRMSSTENPGGFTPGFYQPALFAFAFGKGGAPEESKQEMSGCFKFEAAKE